MKKFNLGDKTILTVYVFIILFLSVWNFKAGAQSAPPSIKGQSSARQLPKPNLQVPFNQATNLGGLDALIETGNDNLLANPGFEASTATSGWTASGGPVSTLTLAADVAQGLKSINWQPNSAGQTFTSTAVTIPTGWRNQNGEASCLVNSVGETQNFLAAFDGTNILAEVNSIASTTYRRVTLNFVFPSSGSISLRLFSKNVSSNMSFDSCYLGLATNIGSVSQATFYGSVKLSGCGSWSTTSTSYVDVAGSGCIYTATGGLAAPTTANRPGFTAANLPPGNYLVIASGVSLRNAGGGGGNGSQMQLFDGTSQEGGTGLFMASPLSQVNIGSTVVGRFNYTSVQALADIRLRLFSVNGSSASIEANTGGNLTFDVYRFPLAQEQTFRADTIGWKVDANISGANPDLGSSNVTTYTGIENGSLTLTNNVGAGNIQAQIPCSGVNQSSGATCAVGNESVGVSFNLLVAGDVLACASFSKLMTTGAGGSFATIFQIVETPNNAQTISQEGKSRVQTQMGSPSTRVTTAVRVCGNFSFSSSGLKTLRLAYEQSATAVVAENLILADADSGNGQRDIHWEVYPINQIVPAPLIAGSVTSGSSGLVRIVSANVTIAPSSCTVNFQLEPWITSGTFNGTGDCTINLAAGIFSSANYSCSAMSLTHSDASTEAIKYVTKTASALRLNFNRVLNTPGIIDNGTFDLICVGPR